MALGGCVSMRETIDFMSNEIRGKPASLYAVMSMSIASKAYITIAIRARFDTIRERFDKVGGE